MKIDWVTLLISVVACLVASQILLAVQINKLIDKINEENRVFLEKVKYTALEVIMDKLRK